MPEPRSRWGRGFCGPRSKARASSRPTWKGGAPGGRGWTTALGVRGWDWTVQGSREITNALTRTDGGGRVLGRGEGSKAGGGRIHHGTMVFCRTGPIPT